MWLHLKLRPFRRVIPALQNSYNSQLAKWDWRVVEVVIMTLGLGVSFAQDLVGMIVTMGIIGMAMLTVMPMGLIGSGLGTKRGDFFSDLGVELFN